jgi:hypothetical protein
MGDRDMLRRRRHAGAAFTQFAAFAEGTMRYTFTLTTFVPGSPREVYEAWLSSRAHS